MQRRSTYGGDNVGVGSAAADISGHALADLVVRELGVGSVAGLKADDGELALTEFLEQGGCGTDLTGSAKATLEGVVFEERCLDRGECVGLGEAFDGGDPRTIRRRSEGEAGVDATAVDEDGAGSALAAVAPFLGAGES
jgi:hypothetical protein